MHKGLIFDLDGVLVDTAKYHFLAWKEIAAELGIPFDEKDNELLKGVSRQRSFEIILELSGMEMERSRQEEYCKKKNEIYLEYIHKLTEKDVLPGAVGFLSHAREQGYKISLGSASKNAKYILERLDIRSFFDAIADGTNVSKAKPDPEVFVKGAQMLGLLPEECVVFEDSAAGILAAHNGNMKAVGIGSAEHLPDADILSDSLEHITIEEIEKKL